MRGVRGVYVKDVKNASARGVRGFFFTACVNVDVDV